MVVIGVVAFVAVYVAAHECIVVVAVVDAPRASVMQQTSIDMMAR